MSVAAPAACPAEPPAPGRGRSALRIVLPLALAALIAATVGGLARMGVLPVTDSTHRLAIAHGPLLISGFFGTVIAVERIAERAGIAWAAPPLLLASGFLQLSEFPDSPTTLGAATALAFAGSALVHASDVAAAARRPTVPAVVTALASLAWCGGSLLWLNDRPIADASPWWLLFLVLVIAAERLEEAQASGPFVLAAAAVALGALGATEVRGGEPALRLLGVAFAAIGLALLASDRAVRRARLRGPSAREGRLGRAVACGLAWLVFAGGLLSTRGWIGGGLAYDAVLHAVTVGFVLSMLFGHGPVVLPKLINHPVATDQVSEVPLLVLQVGLLLRVTGDLFAQLVLRRLGGALGGIALLLFLLSVARAVLARKACASRAGRAG